MGKIRIIALICLTFGLSSLQSYSQGVVARPTQPSKKNSKNNKNNSNENSLTPIAIQKQDIPKKSNQPTKGLIVGHEWVDLGLPSGVKWATCNVGASNSSENGKYFICGETVEYGNAYVPKNRYKLLSEGIINSSGTINRQHDAASANWGGSWRMPTEAEVRELLSKCHWTWTSINGKRGFKITGPNNNTIFLPAAGYHNGSDIIGFGNSCSYWSSSINRDGSAYYWGGGSEWGSRGYKRPVRPVTN